MNMVYALHGAEFVWVNGTIFRTDYLRIPDDETTADDVILEGSHDNMRLMLTQSDIQKAKAHEDGSFEFGDGVFLRFLSSASLH
ncbi:MAG: hypothetical protein RLZZ502_154 [Pseudomonadota bacterium]|jgi:hypothetical protein